MQNRHSSFEMDQSIFEQRLKSVFRENNIIARLSTSTYHVDFQGDPNVEHILRHDTTSFTTSAFCSSAYEWRSQMSLRVRIYPTSRKIMVMGCKSFDDCIESLEELRCVLGTLHILNIRCILLNLNLNLPWTVNRHIESELSQMREISFVDMQERHPCMIVHIVLRRLYVKKALLYPKAGKISLHTSSWEDAKRMWELLWPPLRQCKGISKTLDAE